MKKIWKKRKNSEAVSPVIATILMVAITVVLAAVLYVMVMGFGTTGNQTPTGSFVGNPSTLNTSAEKLQFGVITPSTTWVSCKFTMTAGGVSSTPVALTLASGTSTQIVAATVGAANYKMVITDLAADGKISTGDYVTVLSYVGAVLTPYTAATTYTVTLLFTSTGGSITSQSWTP